MQTRSLLTHSTWQEKKTRLRRRNAKRVEARGWVGGRRTAAGPRARGGNAAGTYLCGTRARYPDTGRAHEAMDATTSRGLTNLTRRLFFLRVQKALFPPVSIPTRQKTGENSRHGIFPAGESARPDNPHSGIFSSHPELSRKHPFCLTFRHPFFFFVFSAFPHWTLTHENGRRCAYPTPIARRDFGSFASDHTPRRSNARSRRGARRTPEGRARARPRLPRTRRRWRSEMHGARYGSAPPCAAATDTASPETTPLHGVSNPTRAPDKTRPSDRPRPRPPQE